MMIYFIEKLFVSILLNNYPVQLINHFFFIFLLQQNVALATILWYIYSLLF